MREYRFTFQSRLSEQYVTVTAADANAALELAVDKIVKHSALMVRENGSVQYQYYWTEAEAARRILYMDVLPCRHAEIEVRVDTDGEEYAVCLDCDEDVEPLEQPTAVDIRATVGAEIGI